MENTPGLNDYLQALTFGSGLSFTVTLDGAAINDPAYLSTAGTAFGFSLDDGVNVLSDENPRGVAGVLNVGTFRFRPFPSRARGSRLVWHWCFWDCVCAAVPD